MNNPVSIPATIDTLVSIREEVKAIRAELHEGDIQPERAAECLNILSSVLGNISDGIRIRDLAYNLTLLDCYKLETKANRAKILAETSPEYVAMREAKDTEKEAIEMIRSLKYYLKVKEREYMHTPR